MRLRFASQVRPLGYIGASEGPASVDEYVARRVLAWPTVAENWAVLRAAVITAITTTPRFTPPLPCRERLVIGRLMRIIRGAVTARLMHLTHAPPRICMSRQTACCRPPDGGGAGS